MSPDRHQPAKPDPTGASTSQKLADALHYRGLARSYAIFLDVAAREDRTEPHAADLLRSTYEDLCGALEDAEELTGNREPEMAEVISELQRLEEEYREILN